MGRVPLTGDGHPSRTLTDAPAEQPSGGPDTLVQRGGWTLAWFAVLTAGLGFWSAWTSWPGAAALAPMLVVAGVAGMAATWLVADPRVRALPWAGLGAAVVAVGLPEAVAIHVRRYYTTDSAAFNQLATRAFLHGKDPYETSMASAAGLLNPPAHYWTYLADGGHITQVSYPAASFLLEAPAMALGFHHELADWTDLVAWLATGILLFVLLPVGLRWLAVLVLMASAFVGAFSAGGTDALFLPFLVVAVWRWDRFGAGRGAGAARWIGPVALGVACSVKQTPWFCVPILVIGLALEARRRGDAVWRVPARYLAVVVGVFAACNLPFVIWGPRAWADGLVLPFTKPLVADGQGLVTLAIHGLTGGVVLPLLSVAAALAYVALLVAFVVWYPAMKVVWLFVLPVVLVVPGRSFSSYLIDFFPAALVAAVSVAGVPRAARVDLGPAARRWVARSAVGRARARVGGGLRPGLDLGATRPVGRRRPHLPGHAAPRCGDGHRAQPDRAARDPALLGGHRQPAPFGLLDPGEPAGPAGARGRGDAHRHPPPQRVHLVARPRRPLAGRGLHHLARRPQHLGSAGLVARSPALSRSVAPPADLQVGGIGFAACAAC